MESFGSMVRKAREKKEWTVRTFRERLGVKISPAYITKIEVKDEIPSPSLTLRIAEVLDIDFEKLVEAAKESRRRMFNEMLNRKWEEIL